MVLPGNLVMVQAAHLIPFSEAEDDDPRNGIALTPDFHWLMDRGIIAPGPDLKWHVSKLVDDRISDNHAVIALQKQALILPKDERFWPRADALVQRLRMLKC
jgi:putative restriction endonuclease